MNDQVRFYEIDLLRFIAALMVVVFHYTFVGYMLGYAPEPRHDDIGIFSRYLYLGINFFFVISGFVILMSARDGQAKRFVVSRFRRLYPAYWCAVLLTALVIALYGQPQFEVSWSQLVVNLTMLQGGVDVAAVDSAYWTLWIELKFYLIIFVLALTGRLRWLAPISLVLLIASIAALYHPYAQSVNPFINAFPHWWGYFACGCVFYLIRRDGLTGFYALLLLLGLVFSIRQAQVFTQMMTNWYGVEFKASVAMSANLLFFAMFSVIALRDSNPLRRPAFYTLGLLTYPLYLIHQNIGYIIFNHWHQQVPALILVMMTLVVALLLAWAIQHWIERAAVGWFIRFGKERQLTQQKPAPVNES